MKLVLASASPRRRELLAAIGCGDFEICPSAHEPPLRRDIPAEAAVAEIALAKGLDVARGRAEDDIIVAADTLVFLDGEPMGKPRGTDGAARMLRALSGRTHHVITGLAVIRGADIQTSSEVTAVRFRTLSDREIDWYVSTGEPLDKAGAYGIQNAGAMLVEGIDGDYFNVVGLPVCRLALMLRTAGLDLFSASKG